MLKKFTFIALMAAMSVVGANAQAISQDEAMDNAIRFLTSTPENGGARKVMKARPRLHATKLDVKGVYAFNVEGGGFVVASGDSRTLPVLGYGNGGSFDWDNMPQNMREWLKGYGKAIAALGNTSISTNARKADSKRKAINPLINTYWNQSPVYNLECPVYNGNNDNYKGQRTLTGCVATAMAQIMYYYKWPQNATPEIPAYDYELSLQVSKNEFGFGPVQFTKDKLHLDKLPSTTFDWTNMVPHYTMYNEDSETFSPIETTKQQQDAVAHLMRYCGQAAKMEYSPVVSNAKSADAVYALRHYFGYDEGIFLAHRSNYTIDGWEDLIYGEMAEGRPVFYGANSADEGGHVFICDGYDGEGLYHINWGWEGRYDNYFALSVLNPHETKDINEASSSMGYSMEQEAIIGLQPPTGNTKPASEDPELYAVSNFSVNDNNITIELIYYSSLYDKANFKLGLYYPKENEIYEEAYGLPDILTLESPADTCITIPIQLIEHLPKDGCKLYLLYQWADKENSEWQYFGSPNMYINVSPTDDGYVYTPSVSKMLSIQKSYFNGSGEVMDQHDIVLEIQDLGFEFSGTVSLMPVYTNNKDPELIFKSLSSTYETLSGTEVDKGANMKAGVYLKPGETQKVSFTYTPKYPGELMFVLYEYNNKVPLGYTLLYFKSGSSLPDIPDDPSVLDIPPFISSEYEVSYQQAKSADDKFIQGKVTIVASDKWIPDMDKGINYLKVGVTANGKDIVAPKSLYPTLKMLEEYIVPLDFLLKDKLVNDYPQTVTVYVDAITKKDPYCVFVKTLKLGETQKGNNGIGEDAGIPDAIEKVNVDDNVKRYYDLSGRPLNGEPTTSGVYIYKDSSSKMRKVFKK
ncbi:MAG: C10 family peptidase [Prevotella sp.]|nr:C10 family peptidase [Prevotella sp.]